MVVYPHDYMADWEMQLTDSIQDHETSSCLIYH